MCVDYCLIIMLMWTTILRGVWVRDTKISKAALYPLESIIIHVYARVFTWAVLFAYLYSLINHRDKELTNKASKPQHEKICFRTCNVARYFTYICLSILQPIYENLNGRKQLPL